MKKDKDTAVYEAPRDIAHAICVRGVGRLEDEPRSLVLALSAVATDDEIRALHEHFIGRQMLAALAPPTLPNKLKGIKRWLAVVAEKCPCEYTRTGALGWLNVLSEKDE